MGPQADAEDKPEVLGDSAYADGATRDVLGANGLRGRGQVPPVRNATGLFTKDRFDVDLQTNTVTCPAGQHVAINPTRDGGGRASFKVHCKDCPLRRACTKSRAGRTIAVGRHEALLQRPEPSRPPRHGTSATGPTDPSSSARSPTSSAAPGAGARRGREAKHASRTDLDTRAGAHQLGPSGHPRTGARWHSMERGGAIAALEGRSRWRGVNCGPCARNQPFTSRQRPLHTIVLPMSDPAPFSCSLRLG